jgi:hypothetical protein
MVMQATPPRYTSTMRPIDTFARLKLTRRQLLELLLPLAAWLPAPWLLASAWGWMPHCWRKAGQTVSSAG